MQDSISSGHRFVVHEVLLIRIPVQILLRNIGKHDYSVKVVKIRIKMSVKEMSINCCFVLLDDRVWELCTST